MGSTNTTPAPAYTHFDLQPIRAYPRHQPWHTFSQLSQYHHHEHELSTHYTHRTSIVNAPAISHVRRYNTIAIVSTDWYQYQQLPPPTPISSHAHRIQHSPHLLMNKDNYPYICLYRLKFNSSRIHRYASSAQRNIAHMHPHHIPHGALPLLLAPTPTIHSHLCIPCINLKLAIQYNTIVSTDWCWHQQLPPTDIFATSPGIINCNITTLWSPHSREQVLKYIGTLYRTKNIRTFRYKIHKKVIPYLPITKQQRNICNTTTNTKTNKNTIKQKPDNIYHHTS